MPAISIIEAFADLPDPRLDLKQAPQAVRHSSCYPMWGNLRQ